MKILVIGHRRLIRTSLADRLHHDGREVVAVSPALGICAALLAAVCIGAIRVDDAMSSTSRATLAAVHETNPHAAASLLVARSATALSSSARARPTPNGAAQRVQPERSVRALLRAMQTICHLARTAYFAMAGCLSLSGSPWLRALASFGLAGREALTVRANGSDVLSTSCHAA
ncbi:hypothetical protein [Reyranella sp. CPCC 100927]|uniref:hypothetical protein n=1 Tax=Reyranella sp. CPCC 100927 TaxID=2599616 RepID=UPI0011B74D4C|nr:hypothetical protein [Reyranella sp. CPCC 100927]TWT02611.1 hypothetical protein FQU96_30325 [Reyranella sp. CPCC 100927]